MMYSVRKVHLASADSGEQLRYSTNLATLVSWLKD
jgi:hypothetical protein